MYDHGDDARRFVLFTAAALAAQEYAGWRPDVVHANDWHTAIAPAMLRGGHAGAFYVDTASVLTVHNLAYQGWTERGALDGAAAFLPHWVTEHWVNILATGLTTADLITTVSPTYAREILTPEYGEKLEGVLHSRQDRLHGVLNGLDTERFDPSRDPAIPAHYSAEDLSGKAICKEALQREAGFSPAPGAPLLAMVSRLVDQKGFDLFAGAVQGLLHETDAQIVILGTGQPHYHALLEHLQHGHPDRIRAWITFDAALAQRIYAGADLFLMPSRFEPCGLGQMIAMRYGTVPVVRGTGGLADTVHEGPPGEPRTGFVFWEYGAAALLSADPR
jgi:starch synthase